MMKNISILILVKLQQQLVMKWTPSQGQFFL